MLRILLEKSIGALYSKGKNEETERMKNLKVGD